MSSGNYGDERFAEAVAQVAQPGETWLVHDGAYDYHELDKEAVAGEFYLDGKPTGSFIVVNDMAVRGKLGEFISGGEVESYPADRYPMWRLLVSWVELRKLLDRREDLTAEEKYLLWFGDKAATEVRKMGEA